MNFVFLYHLFLFYFLGIYPIVLLFCEKLVRLIVVIFVLIFSFY